MNTLQPFLEGNAALSFTLTVLIIKNAAYAALLITFFNGFQPS